MQQSSCNRYSELGGIYLLQTGPGIRSFFYAFTNLYFKTLHRCIHYLAFMIGGQYAFSAINEEPDAQLYYVSPND
jgi:hypothetical protein